MINLPTEIFISIIAKLDNIEDKRTLANLRLACSALRDLATPSYFSYISFCYCIENIPDQLNNLVSSGLVKHVRHAIIPLQSVVPRSWIFEKPRTGTGYTMSWEALQARMGKRCALIHPEPDEDDMAHAWRVQPVDKIKYEHMDAHYKFIWTSVHRLEQTDSLYEGKSRGLIPQDPQRMEELHMDTGLIPDNILEMKELFLAAATPFFECCSKNLLSLRVGSIEYYTDTYFENNVYRSLAEIFQRFHFPQLKFLHFHLRKMNELYIILGHLSNTWSRREDVPVPTEFLFPFPNLSVFRMYAQYNNHHTDPNLPPIHGPIGRILTQHSKSLNDLAIKYFRHNGFIGLPPLGDNLKIHCSSLCRLALVHGIVDAKSLYSALEASPHMKEIRLSFLSFDNREASYITLGSIFNICSHSEELTFVDIEWLVYTSRAVSKTAFSPRPMTDWYRAPPLEYCSADNDQDLVALRRFCNIVSQRREQRGYPKHPIFELYEHEDCEKAEHMMPY